jgi:hypothetical protein
LLRQAETTAEKPGVISPIEGDAMATRKSTRTAKPTRGSSGKKKTARKYSPSAGKFVEREVREMEEGKLKSGRSGKKVTSRKQAIAIGLSEARKAGKKVPARKG